jgi:ABC-type Fe3+/spermidine/putrescine transport system ATPase subunit
MFEGVLQQYDTPRAFYDRPLTADIARFFRNDNFLEGTKTGAEVETRLGTLQTIITSDQPDGPVLVTVRPEDVQLGATSDNNCIEATVQSSVYMGTYTQLQLDVAGRPWRAQGSADFSDQSGETISVHLPRQRIWLLPRESSPAGVQQQ